MIMAEARGRFLFDVRPDVFPYDHLCRDEIMLWGFLEKEREEIREQIKRG